MESAIFSPKCVCPMNCTMNVYSVLAGMFLHRQLLLLLFLCTNETSFVWYSYKLHSYHSSKSRQGDVHAKSSRLSPPSLPYPLLSVVGPKRFFYRRRESSCPISTINKKINQRFYYELLCYQWRMRLRDKSALKTVNVACIVGGRSEEGSKGTRPLELWILSHVAYAVKVRLYLDTT